MELLDNHRIRHTDAGHANRAREVAAAEHVPPYRLAKTVIFCGDPSTQWQCFRRIAANELTANLGPERVRP
jgi:hypothetical protein